ncbi:MAG: PrgI family protein [Candidatus Saccharibacteria bacterium]|nr:PrgI family protein [Candidatus Saccharibacteria bacterium]
MAQYKVPQDVEAEDRLLGPFTFRQFVYLMIGVGCGAACWGLAQLFLPLAIIPLPFAIFFIVLALPLRKDQPMETYLAAVVSFRLKPNKRLWQAGQRETMILITAPKQVEKSRTRDITEDEASHRLSFLANLVDTEGQSIRGVAAQSSMKEEYVAEANQIDDILEANNETIDRIIAQEQAERHAELVANMRNAIAATDSVMNPGTPGTTSEFTDGASEETLRRTASNVSEEPHNGGRDEADSEEVTVVNSGFTPVSQNFTPVSAPAQNIAPVEQTSFVDHNMLRQAAIEQQKQNLASNTEYSIQTIAAEANRIAKSEPAKPDPTTFPIPHSYTPPVPESLQQPTPPPAPTSYEELARQSLANYTPGQAIFTPGGKN